MKTGKKVMALMLCLCILIGLPISVQAVGTADPEQFEVLTVMVPTSGNVSDSESAGTKAVVLLNGQSDHTVDIIRANYTTTVTVHYQDGSTESLATSVNSDDYYFSSHHTDEMAKVKAQAFKLNANGATFKSCVEDKGAVKFTMRIEEKNSNGNGYFDAWTTSSSWAKTENSKKLKATATESGIDVIVKEIVMDGIANPDLRIEKAIKISDDKLLVKFSKPVAFGALVADGGALDAWLRVCNSSGGYVGYINEAPAQKQITAATVREGGEWVELTVNVKYVEEKLAAAPEGSVIMLSLAEKASNLDPSRGEMNHNGMIDVIWSTADHQPLISAKRSSDDGITCAVSLDEPVQLTGATVHNGESVVLRFSEAVKSPGDVTIALNFYKDGVANTEYTWYADKTTCQYYGTAGDALTMSILSGDKSIASVAEELGSEYSLGLTITSKTKDNDAMVNEICSQANGSVKLLATTIAEQDIAYTKVDTANDSLLELTKVELYSATKVLLSFNQNIATVENLSKKQGVYLTLQDSTGIYSYTPNPDGTFTVYKPSNPMTGEYMAQWSLEKWQTYGNDASKVILTIKDAQRELTSGWTLDRVLKICENSGGSLYFRIQELKDFTDSDVKYPNSGTVDTIYAAGNEKNVLLATNKGSQDQVRYEVQDCRNDIIVKSAELVTEDLIKVTFNKAVTNAWYSTENRGSWTLRLAKQNNNGQWVWQNFYDGTTVSPVQWGGGKAYNYDPRNTDSQAIPADTEASQVWYYQRSGSVDILDLLSMVNDPESSYYGLTLTLALERNGDITVPNSVQNFTTADGAYVLIQNNSGNPGHYTEITTELALRDMVMVEEIAVVDERNMTVTFSDDLASFKTVKTEIRMVDAAGKAAVSIDVSPVKVTDSVYKITLPLSGKYRNFSELWQTAQEMGYTLELSITQTSGDRRDGVIDGVIGVNGMNLVSSFSDANTRDSYRKTFNENDYSFDPNPLTVDKVTQIGAHSLLVEFSDDIGLVDMDTNPYIALRMINPQNGAPISVPLGDGKSKVMQWKSKTVTPVDGRKDALLVTFADTVDISVLVSKINMAEEFINYPVVLVMEESGTAVADGSHKADHLMYHIRRLADDGTVSAKQLESTFKNPSGNDNVLVEIDYIDPDADVTVDKVEVIDQTRIVVTFSEAVTISNPETFIRLVNDSFETKVDENGNKMMWSGKMSYYNDLKTQIVFTLNDSASNHKQIPVTGLDDLFGRGYEDDEWNLMLAISDNANRQILNGLIDAIVSTNGKYVLADPMTGVLDTIFLDINKNEIVQGELTMTDVTVTSDTEAVITFSAPVEITDSPYLAIRLFNEDGLMLWRTAEGEYVTASKNAEGKTNTPMQWSSSKWEWADDSHTKIKVNFRTGPDKLSNFTDILAVDWDALVKGSYLMIGFEESNKAAVQNNGRVDNISLVSDSRIRLRATKLDSTMDGAYLPFTVGYNANKITASAKIINDMQIRISFSQKVTITGTPYIAIRLVDEEGQLIYFGDELGRIAVQFSGTWTWENDAHTSLIWTMNGNNNFGCYNITDIVNYNNTLSMYKGTAIRMVIEEASKTDVITTGRQNNLVENIASLDGTNHLSASLPGSSDGLYLTLNNALLENAKPITLLSVKAVDDQNIELTFSEPVKIAEGDKAPNIILRYLDAKGNSEVLVNGKTANFKGTLSYKEGDPNVIVWTLDSKLADNLSDIFQYAGTFKWNSGARLALIIENTSEGIPTNTMRLWGITSLDGVRTMSAAIAANPSFVLDVEVGYELPAIEEETDVQEAPVVYYSNYTWYITAAAGLFVVMTGIGLIINRRKGKK